MTELIDPVCITQVIKNVEVEKIPILVSASQVEEVVDPRTLLDREVVVSVEDVRVGDWLAKSYWKRPRLVSSVDTCDGGQILFLSEPDTSVAPDGVRLVEPETFNRFTWYSYPSLRALWLAAHS